MLQMIGVPMSRVLGLPRSDQPKAEVRGSAADFCFAAAADQIPRAVLIGAQIRSATNDTLRGSGLLRVVAAARTVRVVRDRTRLRQRRVIIRPVPVGTPLPDVAAHVVEPEPVWWECRHRRCAGVAVGAAISYGEPSLPCVRGSSAARSQLIAPRIEISLESAACRELELRFRRHTLARPLRIRRYILEREMHDRMIHAVLNAAAGSFRVLPV